MFATENELVNALGEAADLNELSEIKRLSALGLPPVTSRDALAVMLGINPGFIWSLENRPGRHYRHFTIPKGKGVRHINAPKVGLKIIQKWLSVHLQKHFQAPEHVFGFIPGRSHIKAAQIHCEARWIYSVDIKDFFTSTRIDKVYAAFWRIGYQSDSARLLSSLCCLNGSLAQGAPTSPVMSNICFAEIDRILRTIAYKYDAKLTRYADDIVFSGTNKFPEALIDDINTAFAGTPWKLSEHKTELSVLPKRLKVHGLLVHGKKIRLTKGYRNRIRAFKYLMAKGRIKPDDINSINGHIRYSDYILSCG